MIPVLRNNILPVKFNGTQRLFAHALFSILGKMIKTLQRDITVTFIGILRQYEMQM